MVTATLFDRNTGSYMKISYSDLDLPEGEDRQFFTIDDRVTSYFLWLEGKDNYLSARYVSPGLDGKWFTGDDEVKYFRSKQILSDGRELVVSGDAGDDGVIYTEDDHTDIYVSSSFIDGDQEETYIYSKYIPYTGEHVLVDMRASGRKIKNEIDQGYTVKEYQSSRGSIDYLSSTEIVKETESGIENRVEHYNLGCIENISRMEDCLSSYHYVKSNNKGETVLEMSMQYFRDVWMGYKIIVDEITGERVEISYPQAESHMPSDKEIEGYSVINRDNSLKLRYVRIGEDGIFQTDDDQLLFYGKLVVEKTLQETFMGQNANYRVFKNYYPGEDKVFFTEDDNAVFTNITISQDVDCANKSQFILCRQ